MSKLKQTQQYFCDALIERKDDITSLLSSNHIEKRLDIYRQTVYENLRNNLFLIYPGIWQIVGEQCANSVALAFVKNKKNLPEPGELDNWASAFPPFLASLVELKDLPYLADFAQFEWLQHLVYNADNEEALTIMALEKIPEENLGWVKVAFLPSLYFLHSPYPLHKIQALLENPDMPNVDLKEGEIFCLLARIEDEIKSFWLEENNWLFLKTLAAGYSLEESASVTLERFPDFDLSNALIFMFNQKIVHQLIA